MATVVSTSINLEPGHALKKQNERYEDTRELMASVIILIQS